MGGLADYADEFEAAAEAADHQAEADAMIVLARSLGASRHPRTSPAASRSGPGCPMIDGDSMVEVCPHCGTAGGFRYRVRTHNTPTGGHPEDPY
jgi:hypothetical protein